MDVSVDPSGTWEVRETLPVPLAEVRTIVDDPRRAAALAPDFRAISVREIDPCQDLSMTVNGPWRSILYVARRCPTATGWRYDLVHSDTITDLYAEWVLAAAGTGTDVRYRLRTDVNYAVPQVLVRRSVKSAAVGTMENLVKTVTAGK
jgi:hypothetical protein